MNGKCTGQSVSQSEVRVSDSDINSSSSLVWWTAVSPLASECQEETGRQGEVRGEDKQSEKYLKKTNPVIGNQRIQAHHGTRDPRPITGDREPGDGEQRTQAHVTGDREPENPGPSLVTGNQRTQAHHCMVTGNQRTQAHHW